MMQANDRVMLHEFGATTLLKRYWHRDTQETVWDVVADTGERFCLSVKYVDRLQKIEGDEAQ